MGDKIDVDLHNIAGAMGSIMGQMGISGGPKGKSGKAAPAPKGKSGGSKAKDRKADKPKQKAKCKDNGKSPISKVPPKKPGKVDPPKSKKP